MTNANKAGIYWGKPLDSVIPKLATWSTVILNESNIYDLPEQPDASQLPVHIKAINSDCKIGVSFNGLALFGNNSSIAGNPYWPIQQKMWLAADETGAWLRYNGVKMSSVPPTARVQTVMFDLRNDAFRYRMADIINNALDSYSGVDFYHIDELHSTLGFMKGQYPTGLPTDVEWTAANKSLIRMIDWPVMGNGSYDLTKYHRTKSRGRYRQNSWNIADEIVALKYDLELPIKQRWTIVNPIGNIDKAQWAKFAYGTGVSIQRWQSGSGNEYTNANLETLGF